MVDFNFNSDFYSISPAISSVGKVSDCSSEGRQFKPGLPDVKSIYLMIQHLHSLPVALLGHKAILHSPHSLPLLLHSKSEKFMMKQIILYSHLLLLHSLHQTYPICLDQPMEANREDAGLDNVEENNDNNPTPPVHNRDADAESTNDPNFNQYWVSQLSNADSWDNFEVELNNFTVAALEKAKKYSNDYNINSNRRRPQPKPNNVPPRAINRRPQNFFDAREASKLQRLYKMAKKSICHITKDNDIKYDDGKGRAEAYFTDVHSGKSIDVNNLKELLQQHVPKANNDEIFNNPFTYKEVPSRLNKMSNTSPGPDELEYKYMKTIDNTGQILTFIFNKCKEEQRIPKLWKTAHIVLIYKKGDNTDPSNFRPIAQVICYYSVRQNV